VLVKEVQWLKYGAGRIREMQVCRVPHRARLLSLLPRPILDRASRLASAPEQKKEAGGLRESLRCLLGIECLPWLSELKLWHVSAPIRMPEFVSLTPILTVASWTNRDIGADAAPRRRLLRYDTSLRLGKVRIIRVYYEARRQWCASEKRFSG
jgi:hypothetical protein